jgi:superfamily II DNA/RNA helicase
LVFVERCSDAELMSSFLNHSGIRYTTVNGDHPHDKRKRVFNEFRSSITPILVATDLYAHGLDIKDLDLVIVANLPKEIETFIYQWVLMSLIFYKEI